jgi:hypothetical protein
MGVHIAHDRDKDVAILYCSTTDWAFGPVFIDDNGHDADERVEAFLRWLDTTDHWSAYEKEPLQTGRRDPRQLTDKGLSAAYLDWRAQEADQWAREHAAAMVEEE